MYNEAPLEQDVGSRDRPEVEKLKAMKAKIRQSRRNMTGDNANNQDGHGAKMEENDFGHVCNKI